ncbi:MAG: hypothetical protein IKB23_00930, partial [Clostridia bacterium]|nr:hypothetical protein [Clostridia bacterium]
KSTLDEVTYADILMIVSDITDPEVTEHLEVTETIISDLGAAEKPRIYVFNKYDDPSSAVYVTPRPQSVNISAKEGTGIDRLLSMLEDVIHEGKRECKLLIPYGDQSVISTMYDKCTVLDVSYEAEGVTVRAILGPVEQGMYKKYISE